MLYFRLDRCIRSIKREAFLLSAVTNLYYCKGEKLRFYCTAQHFQLQRHYVKSKETASSWVDFTIRSALVDQISLPTLMLTRKAGFEGHFTNHSLR